MGKIMKQRNLNAVLAPAAHREAMGLTSMRPMLACAETAFVIGD
jgi:hypothetical protein